MEQTFTKSELETLSDCVLSAIYNLSGATAKMAYSAELQEAFGRERSRLRELNTKLCEMMEG